MCNSFNSFTTMLISETTNSGVQQASGPIATPDLILCKVVTTIVEVPLAIVAAPFVASWSIWTNDK